MKYIINKLLISITLSLMFFLLDSCSKQFLKPKPLSFYSPSNTFNSVDGLQSALNAAAKNLRAPWYGPAPNRIFGQMVFSDIAVDGTTDNTGAQNIAQTITPSTMGGSAHGKLSSWWSGGYSGIKYANTVISYIDEVKWGKDSTQIAKKNEILGKAYFFRSYYYYNLVNEFGDVPWVGSLVTKPKVNFRSVERKVILEKLQKDMAFAVKWVPWENSFKGGVSKGACLQLLTKIDLALTDFDGAIKAASDIINSGYYHLMTQRFGVDKNDPSKNVVWDLFRPVNMDIPENKEAIFLVLSRPQLKSSPSNGTSIMRETVPDWFQHIVTPNGHRGTIDIANNIWLPQTVKYGRGIARIRPSNYYQYTVWKDAASDLRHAPGNWVKMTDLIYNNPALKGIDPYYGKHLQLYNSQGQILCSDTIRSWFGFPHYKLYYPDKYANTNPSGGQGDSYIYRLAGTYLLRAEAYVWENKLGLAAADINKVRDRSHAKPIPSSDITINTVLAERARELYFEGLRKVVLTRIAYDFAMTGKTAPNRKVYELSNFSHDNFFYDHIVEVSGFYNKGVTTNHGDAYKISPYNVLWPIPQTASDGNIEGHINQNVGYPGSGSNVKPLDKIPTD